VHVVQGERTLSDKAERKDAALRLALCDLSQPDAQQLHSVSAVFAGARAQ
jgi:hypothetical protein